ncbi:stalk domain-containing protein [Pseudobacillus sp. 179-B 2D1 NHS]|uniref:stalk domain-containing protein n=1 Tax=Pseudobacillus sp. 179-B 2D1 NHS TaxID=3374292 RepID=UPI003879D3D1
MLKKSVLFIFFLIVISGTVLLIQWIGYEKTSMASQEARVDQEIHVEHKEAGLFVKHTFTRLKAEEPLSIIMPPNALKASYNKKEGKCSFRGQSANIIPAGETFSITYSVKLPSFGTTLLLSDWSIKLKEANAENTIIHFTEEQMREGMWFSGLGSSKMKKLDLIDYYLFQGKGQPGALYWQLKPLKQWKNEKLVVYGESESGLDHHQLDLIGKSLVDGATIIFTGQHPSYLSDRLIIVKDNQQLSRLAESFITSEVGQNYHFKESEEWLAFLIASYKIGRPTGSEKIRRMYNQLNEQLTEEEEAQWKKQLFGLTKEPITAEQLDNILSEVKGANTAFFVKNKNENKPLQSLFFYDSRSIEVNGSETEMQAIVQNGQLFFPLIETLQSLGYEVKNLTGEKSLLVKRKYNTYRFYPSQHRFILNEEKYGLYENALQTYEGRLYINQKWLQKIFLVEVQNKQSIYIQDLDL